MNSTSKDLKNNLLNEETIGKTEAGALDLKDLPSDVKVDDYLGDCLKPFSTRLKVVIEWSFEKKEYVLGYDDKETLMKHI
jgi:hypothetical protein